MVEFFVFITGVVNVALALNLAARERRKAQRQTWRLYMLLNREEK